MGASLLWGVSAWAEKPGLTPNDVGSPTGFTTAELSKRESNAKALVEQKESQTKSATVFIPSYDFLVDMTATVSPKSSTGTIVISKNNKYESSGGQGPYIVTVTYDKATKAITYDKTYRDADEQYKNEHTVLNPGDPGYDAQIDTMRQDLQAAISHTTSASDKKKFEDALKLITPKH